MSEPGALRHPTQRVLGAALALAAACWELDLTPFETTSLTLLNPKHTRCGSASPQKGYDDLQAIVPTCEQQDFCIGSQKLSKAIVLQKTIDYIQFLHKEKKKQEEEVSTLRKDVMALKIMKVNYEQIVKAHQDNPNEGKDRVSDEMKFNVFQGIMDSLFQSFNASISVTSFQELSACVFSWIEEHCKPQVTSPPANQLPACYEAQSWPG
uniref:MAX dimerization protein MLX n=1 Tax=Bubo bubo TaxID=30461 RepID=A0A8C0FGD2_BUBBB